MSRINKEIKASQKHGNKKDRFKPAFGKKNCLFTVSCAGKSARNTYEVPLKLEGMLDRLNRYDLLILDDLSYARKDQAETSVLFELICARYECLSTMITANTAFVDWKKVFPDENTAVAAVDRLIHHCVILEMNVESYRRRQAMEEKEKKSGRPAKFATLSDTSS